MAQVITNVIVLGSLHNGGMRSFTVPEADPKMIPVILWFLLNPY